MESEIKKLQQLDKLRHTRMFVGLLLLFSLGYLLQWHLLKDLGHGDALVEAITLNRRVVGSTSALSAMQGPWASPLPAVAYAVRSETPIQYPCCSRERL